MADGKEIRLPGGGTINYPGFPELPIVNSGPGVLDKDASVRDVGTGPRRLASIDPLAAFKADIGTPNAVTRNTYALEQTQVAEAYLTDVASRETLDARIDALDQAESWRNAIGRGDRIFGFRQGPGAPSLILSVIGPDNTVIPIIDTNKDLPDHRREIGGLSVSPDGNYITYIQTINGDGQTSEMHILDVTDLGNVHEVERPIPHVGLHSDGYASWTIAADGTQGFYYTSRHDLKAATDRSIYYHQLGSNSQGVNDLLVDNAIVPGAIKRGWGNVYGVTNEHPDNVDHANFSVRKTWNLDDMSLQLMLIDSTQAVPFVPFSEKANLGLNIVASGGNAYVVMINETYPSGALLAASLDSPTQRNVVVEGNETRVLTDVQAIGESLMLLYREEGRSVLELLDPKTNARTPIAIPTEGSISFLNNNGDGKVSFVLQSYFLPPTPVVFDLATQSFTLLGAREGQESLQGAITTLEYFDVEGIGKVPAYITRGANTKLDDPNNVALIHGYGASRDNAGPKWNTLAAAFISEPNHLFVHVLLPGDAGRGKAWEELGIGVENRMNPTKAFNGVAEGLRNNGWAGKLFAHGRSAGGQLVLLAGMLRPDLYDGIVAHSPVVDSPSIPKESRFEAESGNWEDPDQFELMLQASPYWQMRMDKNYPPILVINGMQDELVNPGQGLSFITALQEVSGSENPVLFKGYPADGHGSAVFGVSPSSWYKDTLTFFESLTENKR